MAQISCLINFEMKMLLKYFYFFEKKRFCLLFFKKIAAYNDFKKIILDKSY